MRFFSRKKRQSSETFGYSILITCTGRAQILFLISLIKFPSDNIMKMDMFQKLTDRNNQNPMLLSLQTVCPVVKYPRKPQYAHCTANGSLQIHAEGFSGGLAEKVGFISGESRV